MNILNKIDINYVLPPNYGFTHSENSWYGCTNSGKNISITRANSENTEKINGQDKNFVLTISEFPINHKFEEEVNKLIDCIILASSRMRSVVHTSRDRIDIAILPYLSPAYKCGVEITTNQASNTILPIYPMLNTSCPPIDYFGRSFIHAYDQCFYLEPKERMSYSLFSIAHFPIGQIASFILIISAFETLSKEMKVDNKFIPIINDWLDQIKDTDLKDDEKDKLSNMVGNLKQTSKVNNLIRLINPGNKTKIISWVTASRNDFLNDLENIPQKQMDLSDFIKHTYDLRSKIVHGEMDKININEISGINLELSFIFCNLISRKLAKFDYTK